MRIEIHLDKKVSKWLDKLEKSDKKAQIAIDYFLNEKLKNEERDPRTLGRKVQGFNDNRWRWRVGVYRIIALVDERGEIFVIQVIKIAKKGDKTYKEYD